MSGLYRTFKSNYVPYFADGRGRDRYIVYNNAGFFKNYLGTSNNKDFSRTGCFFSTKIVKHIKSPSIKAPNFHYHADGNGRDKYILDNGGGLYTDSKPLVSYRLTDFLRKNEYDYRTPKTRHRVALSRAELKYQKFLRNKEKEIINRLYNNEKKKFMKKLKKSTNEYFSEENKYDTDLIQKNKTSTNFLPRYKFKDNENTLNKETKEFFNSRNENDKNDLISNNYNTYDKEQNESSLKKNIVRFKPKLYFDANNYNSLNGNTKSSILSKTNNQFYKDVERIKTYQSLDRKNLLKTKKQPYFHILNEQTIQN
jgi:hypothetical protein